MILSGFFFDANRKKSKGVGRIGSMPLIFTHTDIPQGFCVSSAQTFLPSIGQRILVEKKRIDFTYEHNLFILQLNLNSWSVGFVSPAELGRVHIFNQLLIRPSVDLSNTREA